MCASQGLTNDDQTKALALLVKYGVTSSDRPVIARLALGGQEPSLSEDAAVVLVKKMRGRFDKAVARENSSAKARPTSAAERAVAAEAKKAPEKVVAANTAAEAGAGASGDVRTGKGVKRTATSVAQVRAHACACMWVTVCTRGSVCPPSKSCGVWP